MNIFWVRPGGRRCGTDGDLTSPDGKETGRNRASDGGKQTEGEGKSRDLNQRRPEQQQNLRWRTRYKSIGTTTRLLLALAVAVTWVASTKLLLNAKRSRKRT